MTIKRYIADALGVVPHPVPRETSGAIVRSGAAATQLSPVTAAFTRAQATRTQSDFTTMAISGDAFWRKKRCQTVPTAPTHQINVVSAFAIGRRFFARPEQKYF